MDVLKAMIRLSIPAEAGHYGILIENFCKASQYNNAVKLLDKLTEKEIILRPQSTLHMEPSAYNPIIEYLCNNGQTAKAEILLRQLMKMGVQEPIASYLKKNESADAKTTLDSMIENGHLLDSSLYRSVMESLFEDGRIQTASRVMKTMLEKGLKDHEELIAKILEDLLMRGHVEEAIGRIDLLMVIDLAPHFDSLLSVLCEKGKTISALKLSDFGLERD
ncbi:unnamed protein product [Fraxinus pennsylvanica]|uniref:Pentatricopeptide repeat-containing protein n=1 Tax=Fraxinus pennsylvanica TaxID=56036 RepID=A0AAD2A818_9LAMI|nr:unnamed protein product [Fraxinus pennsylvanica]